jgi:AraC-like DNA-binding protein
MMNWESAAIGGAAVATFGAAWCVATPREGRAPDRWLAGILLLVAANTLHPLVFGTPGTGESLLEPLQYWVVPVVLGYLRTLAGRKPWGWDWGLAAVPVPFLAGVRTWGEAGSVAFWGLLVVSTLVAMVPAGQWVHRHRVDLEATESVLAGVDPGWIRHLMAALATLAGLYALGLVLVLHGPAGFPIRPLLSLGSAVVGVWLTWKAVRRRPLPPAAPDITPAKGATIGSDAETARLEALIRRRRLFTDPELTLDQLAAAAGLTRHEASAALNRGIGGSFYERINRLRIEEFQRLCADPGRRDDKILTLAFEAGFNSKPGFNAVVKRMTGLTPSELRRQAEIGSHPVG